MSPFGRHACTLRSTRDALRERRGRLESVSKVFLRQTLIAFSFPFLLRRRHFERSEKSFCTNHYLFFILISETKNPSS